MVMPSPGVRMPTMRSPGTAPPLGAKRTGKSELIPRMGMAAPGSPGTFTLTDLARLRPNQPLSGFGCCAFLLVVGIHRPHHVGCAQLATTDRRHHLLERGTRQSRQRALELFVGI